MKTRQGIGRVRIIGGVLRGRRISVPSLDGLRPTPDRTRETLFNWLGPLHDHAVLDLFAGSGALGLEACSRGAESVTLVEGNPQACQALQQTVQAWRLEGVTVCEEDALHWLGRQGESQSAYDLVFLDPPFDSNLLDAALTQLQQPGVLAPGARIYVEFPPQREPAAPSGWHLHRQGRSPHTRYALFRT